MTHQVGKKWVMGALTGAALVMGSLTSLNAQAGWTDWLNRDNPNGSGDWETLRDFADVCPNPTDIQARRKSDQVDAAKTGEVFQDYSPEVGLVCKNAEQPDGKCSDYEVRFFCPDVGVCVLDFAEVKPAVSYTGYPNYFNSSSFHEHSITDKWNSVVVKRFLSCYEPRWKTFIDMTACKAAVGTVKHIWYPRPDGQDAKVTSAHWFKDAESCAQLKALEILPPGVKLLASFEDDALEASVNGNQVDLTLKTLSEEDVLGLLILRVKADDNGLLQVQPVCSWGSNGNKVSGASYDCTDKNGSAGSVYMPASVDNKGEYTLYLDKKVTAE
jgi:hypothetical protein